MNMWPSLRYQMMRKKYRTQTPRFLIIGRNEKSESSKVFYSLNKCQLDSYSSISTTDVHVPGTVMCSSEFPSLNGSSNI